MIAAAEFDSLFFLHLGISVVNFDIGVVVYEIYDRGASDGLVRVINAVVALTVLWPVAGDAGRSVYWCRPVPASVAAVGRAFGGAGLTAAQIATHGTVGAGPVKRRRPRRIGFDSLIGRRRSNQIHVSHRADSRAERTTAHVRFLPIRFYVSVGAFSGSRAGTVAGRLVQRMARGGQHFESLVLQAFLVITALSSAAAVGQDH